MFSLATDGLKALRANGQFVRSLHHLRHLGCTIHSHDEGDCLVAGVFLRGSPNAQMQRELQRALTEVSCQIIEPCLVFIDTGSGPDPSYIGPRAEQSLRLFCLRQAERYADRAGEHRLAQALHRCSDALADVGVEPGHLPVVA